MTNDEAEFESRLERALSAVTEARDVDKRLLADALRALGNLERRRPDLRDDANRSYAEAAEIYRELNMPLDEGWVTRHIGINHEYAERLIEAEIAYEKALELYRQHSGKHDLDHANAVRCVAVIKTRLDRTDESESLWRGAVERYEECGIAEGIVEGMLHLSQLAIESGNISEARKMFEKAEKAAQTSEDPDTHTFVEDVGKRLRK